MDNPIKLFMKDILKIMKYIETNNLYPDLRIIEGAPEPEIIVDGKKTLMFSSNNYLGLSSNSAVKKAAKDAIDKYGVGADGSRLLSGNLKIHRELEKKIAKFKGGEDAIVWPSGYSANVGAVSAIMKPIKVLPRDFLKWKGVIFSDELNHASIIDGIIMSRQKKIVYKHNDMQDLERKLKKYKNRRKLVVTDSVFSMDGDIAPLDKIVGLCKKYNAISMIDEAHSTGILGDTGHGALEHFGLKASKDVNIVLGTFSKALAATGGFVVGDKALIRYLRVASRSYMFSTAMTPAASAALIKSLEIIETEPKWRRMLLNNSEYLRNGFSDLGFDIFGSKTQIIPILIGDELTAVKFSRKLFENGVFAPCVRWPAVEKGAARIRFTVMATHTKNQLDRLLELCKELKGDLDIK